jgi:hypothetical protein
MAAELVDLLIRVSHNLRHDLTRWQLVKSSLATMPAG